MSNSNSNTEVRPVRITDARTRYNLGRKVVSLRTRDLMTWKAIGQEIGTTGRMARRLFQERVGKGQHHDHLPGRPGRWPASYVPVEEAYLPGKGGHNPWERVERPEEV